MQIAGDKTETYQIHKAKDVRHEERFLLIINEDGDEFRYALDRLIHYRKIK
jgi:hypothetical protein